MEEDKDSAEEAFEVIDMEEKLDYVLDGCPDAWC